MAIRELMASGGGVTLTLRNGNGFPDGYGGNVGCLCHFGVSERTKYGAPTNAENACSMDRKTGNDIAVGMWSRHQFRFVFKHLKYSYRCQFLGISLSIK